MIVVPTHGRGTVTLSDCAVHIRDPERWRRLEPDEVGDRLRLVPSVLDFRSL